MKTIIYLYEGSFRAVRHRLSGIYTHAWRAGWNLRPVEGSSIRGGLDKVFLAARPNATLKEIHLACGYSSPRALRELFRRHAGCSISEWRKRERAEAFAKMPHNGSRKV